METLHNEDKKNKRILLFPCLLKGHLKPMMQLADVLYANGFSITIIHHTHIFFPASTYPHYEFIELPGPINDVELAQLSPEDVVSVFQKLITNSVDPLKSCLAMQLASSGDNPITCLISDSVWYFSQAVADNFQLPRICLRTSSACALLALTKLPGLTKKGYLLGLHQQEAPIEELPPLKVKDLPLIKAGTFDSTFHELSNSAIVQANMSAGLILNSDEGLESVNLEKIRQSNPLPIYAIGPSLRRFSSPSYDRLDQDRDCLNWLDNQEVNSVLYVSFGSIAAISYSVFKDIASGLVKSGVPFVWVIRRGLVSGVDNSDLLRRSVEERVRRRGCVVEWAPQQEILAHSSIGGFWTHNGWNSTFESLCEGVPMICSPNFGDQMVNARYVSDVWKVGIHMEGKFQETAIESAIRRLMEEDEGKSFRENAAIMKRKIEMSSECGGCSSLHLQRLISHISSLP